MSLTGEQRYRQAKRKARLIMQRNLRHYLEGKREDSGPCGVDLEAQCISKEFDRMQAELARPDR